jgi:N-acyl-D-aspartate/D-glutamate deacylase
MHDLVIRGGNVVDGTGADAFSGDVAIDDGKITQVGGDIGPAKREMDADGLLVTPGWVDIHTHYDGQATWDPVLAPSSVNGVTTIMFGNCGVGFAPARPEHRDALIELMEGVEDIPGSALNEGLDWDWETFPEYLDALERRPRVIDIAAQMPHHALRVYVMGERAIRHERATADDIEAMSKFTEEALRAGAFGFTTSRTDQHKTTSGALVPGRFSEPEELIGIGRGMAKAGRGAFGMISDFEDEAMEFKWLNELGKVSGRPLWFLLTDRAYDPQRWRRLIGGVHAARENGVSMTAEVACRAVGLVLGLSTSLTPFSIRPTFKALETLPKAEKLARLRDPKVRAAILSEAVSDELMDKLPPLNRQIATRWDRLYVLGDPPNYEPEAERSVAAMAAANGQTPEAFAYDYLTGADGERNFYFPVTNYTTGDYGPVREMLTDSGTLLGLSDGGAHCGVICDAASPTFMLTHWARDRSRGPRLPLEWVVKAQTSETADFFGFKDRGRLVPGMKADVNLIDYEKLRMHPPRIEYDLPAGGKRLLQSADGYVATIVSGETTFENGIATDARPGRLVRATDG